MKYCKCGCETPIPEHTTWVKGHHGRGKKRTAQEIENMKKGITDEHRQRLSQRVLLGWQEGSYDVMFGDANPSKRPEVAAKIAAANSRRIVREDTKVKIRKAKLGKPGAAMSESVRRAYSQRMKEDNPMYRKEVLEKHPVLKSGSSFISKGETILAGIFTELGLTFYHQYQLQKERGYYTVDFFFPVASKIIEFDGHDSHRIHPENDISRDAYIKCRYGYETLRLNSPELNNRNRETLIHKIKEYLK